MAGVSKGGERIGGAERRAAASLAAGRIALGAGLWLAPKTTAGMLGFGPLDAVGITVTRIAATRDLVLGWAQLASLGDAEHLRRATVRAAVADAGDAATFALAFGDRRTRVAGLRGLLAAAVATAAGAWLASRLDA